MDLMLALATGFALLASFVFWCFRSANKKSGTNAAARATVTTKPPATEEEYFARLTAKTKEIGALGNMLIVGVHEEDDSEEESGEGDDKELTPEQLGRMRRILITQSRADNLEKYNDFVLGDQAGNDILMFNTSFSYHVLPRIMLCSKAAVSKRKPPDQRFDELFAFTYAIWQHDVWAHDHESPDAVVKAVDTLGVAWAILLKYSDDELGIDAEYTRPGIYALCEQVQRLVAHVENRHGQSIMKWEFP